MHLLILCQILQILLRIQANYQHHRLQILNNHNNQIQIHNNHRVKKHNNHQLLSKIVNLQINNLTRINKKQSKVRFLNLHGHLILIY